jgi:hypothetical protein
MGKKRIKVLYIAGRGRSGSTILSNILAQAKGFFSAGELRLWHRRLKENRPCGCGHPLTHCEVWRSILGQAFAGAEGIDQTVLDLHESRLRLPSQLLMLMKPNGRSGGGSIDAYAMQMEALYRAIQSTTGCQVVVDSSKSPLYAYLLGLMPNIDLYLIHLIRDSRAVAYSWERQARQTRGDDPLHRRQLDPVRSSLLWNIGNILTEYVAKRLGNPFLQVRYEDFAASPRMTVESILRFVAEETSTLPFLTENKVLLNISHTISGNPNRFRTGPENLQPDNEWKTKMKPSQEALVTSLTLALLSRYGYL